MRRRAVATATAPEYPRPVLPADLSEEQQDALLDQLMTALLAGVPPYRVRTDADPVVRVPDGDDWGLDDDVIEL